MAAFPVSSVPIKYGSLKQAREIGYKICSIDSNLKGLLNSLSKIEGQIKLCRDQKNIFISYGSGDLFDSTEFKQLLDEKERLEKEITNLKRQKEFVLQQINPLAMVKNKVLEVLQSCTNQTPLYMELYQEIIGVKPMIPLFCYENDKPQQVHSEVVLGPEIDRHAFTFDDLLRDQTIADGDVFDIKENELFDGFKLQVKKSTTKIEITLV